MIDSTIKNSLLLISSGFVQRGYVAKGNEDSTNDRFATTNTPKNVMDTYKEVLEKFMAVDKLLE